MSMMDLEKLPTDRLSKLATIGGLCLVVVSIVLPISAMWSINLQKNKVEGERRELDIRRQRALEVIESHRKGIHEALEAAEQANQKIIAAIEHIRTIKISDEDGIDRDRLNRSSPT